MLTLKKLNVKTKKIKFIKIRFLNNKEKFIDEIKNLYKLSDEISIESDIGLINSLYDSIDINGFECNSKQQIILNSDKAKVVNTHTIISNNLDKDLFSKLQIQYPDTHDTQMLKFNNTEFKLISIIKEKFKLTDDDEKTIKYFIKSIDTGNLEISKKDLVKEIVERKMIPLPDIDGLTNIETLQKRNQFNLEKKIKYEKNINILSNYEQNEVVIKKLNTIKNKLSKLKILQKNPIKIVKENVNEYKELTKQLDHFHLEMLHGESVNFNECMFRINIINKKLKYMN